MAIHGFRNCFLHHQEAFFLDRFPPDKRGFGAGEARERTADLREVPDMGSSHLTCLDK